MEEEAVQESLKSKRGRYKKFPYTLSTQFYCHIYITCMYQLI